MSHQKKSTGGRQWFLFQIFIQISSLLRVGFSIQIQANRVLKRLTVIFYNILIKMIKQMAKHVWALKEDTIVLRVMFAYVLPTGIFLLW